jgi:hypothetical protein
MDMNNYVGFIGMAENSPNPASWLGFAVLLIIGIWQGRTKWTRPKPKRRRY